MNAAQLLAHFDRLAEAPGAVARLRRFILDLAVRGKLVEQDAGDEPATRLVKHIEAEKSRLVQAGLAAKQEVFKFRSDAETPFVLPNAWVWVPATFPAHIISDLGKKVQTKEVLQSGEFPVVDQGKVFIRGYCNDQDKVIRVAAPLILFGDHTRETKLIDFDFVVGADGVKLLQPVCLFTRYYFLSLKWLPLDSRGYGRHFKLLKSALIPLPPLAEQHRIVAKVDELMALCDQLEAAQQEREHRRDRLAAASLQRLNQPALDATPEAQREHARFHLHHLPRLTTRPEHIKAMRQTFFNLAVCGKLVEQESDDEPVAKLLKRLGVNVVKPRSDLNLHTIPATWTWVTVDEIASVSSGTTPSREVAEYYSSNGTPWVTSGETSNAFITATAQHVTNKALKETSLKLYPPGTLIVAMYGQGKTRGQIAELCIAATTNQACAAIVLKIEDQGHRRYVKLFFQKIYEEIREIAAGGAQPNLNGGKIKSTLIPLPPLAEQHRIVAKVDALMALCDQLEAQLTTTQTDSRRLLEAVLEAALTPV